ncbi:hypothetical protein AB9F35_34200, partial [Rhizobium leguminosarum]
RARTISEQQRRPDRRIGVLQAAGTFGDGLGVVAASQKKEDGYLFCQWAISHEMGARLLQAGAGVPLRQSVLEDAKVREGVKMPGAWLDA